jgi:uncharacterized membrane protein YbhN (UPF0104 family)
MMLNMNQALTVLTEINLDDLSASVGTQGRPRLASALRRVFHPPARKFARQMLEFDRAAGVGNLPGAARGALPAYVRDVRVFGRENLPASGPVIVLSNHPGLSDTLCLFAAINRADLRIIAVDRPFLRALPNVSGHLFYVSEESAHRMGAVRRTSAHLRVGGAVMTFPAGEIEPDPAVYDGAQESLSTWTDSAGVFLRFEPRTVIVPVLVRNVVWKRAAQHPLTRLRRTRADRERFAAALQLAAHLLFGVRPVVVSVQCAPPITLEEVGSTASTPSTPKCSSGCAACWRSAAGGGRAYCETRGPRPTTPLLPGEAPERGRNWRRAVRALWLALLAAALVWGLKNAPLSEIWAVLQQLQGWQIAGLLAFNAIIFLLITTRWWVIVRAENGDVPIHRLYIYRLAAFGLSYFTLGPQVGGEPLQVVYLQNFHRLTYARATASVILDKLLEFSANILFLAGGLVAVIRVGILAENGIPLAGSVVPLAAILILPAVYAGLLYVGYYPLGVTLRRILPSASGAGFPRLLVVSERMAAAFTRRHVAAMAAALGVSLVGCLGLTAEYWLMAHFLGIQLTPWQALAGMTMALLSFLLPIPAGLGALEASQVLALGAMGFPPADALGLTLLIRGRDIVFAGLGLLIAGRRLGSQ